MNQAGELNECFRVVEVSDAAFVAGGLFQLKFGDPIPDYGRHLVALYQNHSHQYVPVGYLNVFPHDTVALIGGGCTDGRAFEYIDQQHADAIRASGGTLFNLLRYAFTRMATDYEAFFGYCGDARAEEVDLAAGFKHTGVPQLLVNFHRPVVHARRETLIKEVAALGPF